LLEIINLDTTQSFCQFYPVNRFNNIQGTITIECGAPSPGFNGKNTIAKIKFFAKTIGNAIIKIKPTSQILLNNGKGTNIFSGPSQKTVLILNSI